VKNYKGDEKDTEGIRMRKALSQKLATEGRKYHPNRISSLERNRGLPFGRSGRARKVG